MQLSRVLVRAGKARWLLGLVPLLAAGAVVGYLFEAEPESHTFATVSVVPPEGRSTAATVTQAVDGFRSAVTSDNVVQLAQSDSGVSVVVDRELRADRVGTSNLVELRVTTQPGEHPAQLLRGLVQHTNDALFSSTLASAEARLQLAEERYDEALEARGRQLSSTGLLLPIESYRAKASEVTQLRVALATTAGDITVDREGLRHSLRLAGQKLRRIGESVAGYESVQENVVRTRAELAEAEHDLDTTHTRLQAALSEQSITVSEPSTQPRRTTLVRGAVAGLVVGLTVSAGLVLLIGLLRGPRGRDGAP